ncbi:MAG: hypothetical protein JXB05_03940 [Myxococcaceae bacterium]|nr:hypothetical protein [Myxococcaceae bacterium]
MKGDFTRRSFSREKHYSGVRMQQGRVQLDSDWNEQVDIQNHLRRTLARDTQGASGAPKASGNVHFALSVAAGGADLAIAPGRIYVDGILCELEQASSYLSQPDFPLPSYVTGEGASRALSLPTGTFLAYLDVWERLVTALEDPGIREVALGGPDTTVRTRTVWQVKLLPLSADPAATSWSVNLPGPSTVTLAARAQPIESGQQAGLVPARAGYRRLENQLYRVEVHSVTQEGRVTAKWSRDNGAVVAPWVSGSGDTVTIGSAGRNELLDFTSAPFVELTDDARELHEESGLLYAVKTASGAKLTLDITSEGSPGAVNMASFTHTPKVRRWDGVLEWDLSLGEPGWLPLEDGVEVKPGVGLYRVGDSWLIPARHLTADIEWPQDGAGEPLPQPPHGGTHHYAHLAILRKAASLTVEDQRKVLPALTELAAEDVSFDPSIAELPEELGTVQEAIDYLHLSRRDWAILLLPGDDVAQALAKIGPGQSARVHFAPGTFNLPGPLVLSDKGDLQFSGSGPATRLVGTGAESLLSFERCRSVLVRELHAETDAVNHAQGLAGPLAFVDCPSVTVENVSLRCGAHWRRGAACISVRNLDSTPPTGSAPPSTARIRSCDLRIGHQQVGILLVNVDRSQVEDNVLTTYEKPAAVDVAMLVEEREYRSLMRRLVLSRPRVLPKPLTNPEEIVTGQLGPYSVYFDADRSLLTAWQDILRVESPRIPVDATASAVSRRLRFIAYELLRDKGVPNVAGIQSTTITAFRNWFERWRASSSAVASQGITVGGQRATEVRIRDNTLRDVLQGIHVGLSQFDSSVLAGNLLRAGRVHITGNEVHVLMTPEALGERHGIFVGHCDTLQLEGNHVRIDRRTFHSQSGIDAIRVHGSLGRMLSIRQNHLLNPSVDPDDVGIRVKALNKEQAPVSLWRVSDNLSACQTPEVLELAPAVLAPAIRLDRLGGRG